MHELPLISLSSSLEGIKTVAVTGPRGQLIAFRGVTDIQIYKHTNIQIYKYMLAEIDGNTVTIICLALRRSAIILLSDWRVQFITSSY